MKKYLKVALLLFLVVTVVGFGVAVNSGTPAKKATVKKVYGGQVMVIKEIFGEHPDLPGINEARAVGYRSDDTLKLATPSVEHVLVSNTIIVGDTVEVHNNDEHHDVPIAGISYGGNTEPHDNVFHTAVKIE